MAASRCAALPSLLDRRGRARDVVGADAGGRAVQRMRQRRHRLRLAAAHARQQQTGLPVEQLQHLALEAAVAERHAREMAAVDGRAGARARSMILSTDCAMKSPRGLCGPFLSRVKFDLAGTKIR